MVQAIDNKRLIYEFGKFVLDPGERILLADGKPVHMADKLFDTLCLLIQNNGRLLTKDEMMASIWEESFVEESNLAKNVSRLRKILNTDGDQLIETIPRRGYRFNADVKSNNGDTELLTHRRLRIKMTHTADYEEQDKVSARTTGEEIQSIAVLPLQPLDANDNDDPLGLGLTDALITQMSRAGQIQVRPTSSILKYDLADQDTVIAGQELRVDAILVGRYQRSQNKLRLTVQLLRTDDGAVLWADSFNTDIEDIFSMQDQIAERVIGSLCKKLTDEVKARISRRYTENVEAYGEYLRGRVCWNKRTTKGYGEALECFGKAIEIDPSYALAYAGLADIYNLLPLFDGYTPSEYIPKAKDAALKALSIDGDLAEAHAALGLAILHYDWNWAGAEASFRRAIKLNPGYSTAHQLLGVYLCRVGRIGDAIIALQRAQQLDPLSPIHATWLAEALRYYGETEASIRLHTETLETFPDFYLAHYHLAFSYIDARDFTAADRHRREAVALSNENSLTLSLQGILQAALHDDAGLHRTLEKLLRMRNEMYTSAVNIASVYAASGKVEESLMWLEKAVTDRDPNLTWIKFDKEFEFLHDDRRFKSVLVDVGLGKREIQSISFRTPVRRPAYAWTAALAMCVLVGSGVIFYSLPQAPKASVGGATNITNNVADDNLPAWSPDGKRLTVVSNRTGAGDVYVMNADGGGLVRLTDSAAREHTATWSPDGTKIVFDSERDGNREIYIMNSDGSGQTRLTFNSSNDCGPAHFSPDGSRIVFSRNESTQGMAAYNYDIFTMNVDGSDIRQLTYDKEYDAEPFWSADGTKILFTSGRTGSFDAFSINLDGSGEVNLTNSTEADGPIGMTMDGRHIILFGNTWEQQEIYQLSLVDQDGRNRRPISSFKEKIHRIVFSPDHKKLAFSTKKDGNFEIYTMDSMGLPGR